MQTAFLCGKSHAQIKKYFLLVLLVFFLVTVSTVSAITQTELPGSSISFELGGLSRDTVELRDGTVLLGDVVSLSLTAVVVRVDDSNRTYDRNQIKKIMLVERVVTQEPPVTRPVPIQPKQ